MSRVDEIQAQIEELEAQKPKAEKLDAEDDKKEAWNKHQRKSTVIYFVGIFILAILFLADTNYVFLRGIVVIIIICILVYQIPTEKITIRNIVLGLLVVLASGLFWGIYALFIWLGGLIVNLF